MRDRVPASGKAGRVSFAVENIIVTDEGVLKIGDDNGVLYGILGHADDASVEGSAYTKSNVLPASVTKSLGINATTSEPKDAFIALNNKITAANANIATVTNLVNGNYADITTSDAGTHSTGQNDGHSDWRTGQTNCTDFLVSYSYRNGLSRDLIAYVNVGSVSISRTIPKDSGGTHSGRIWLSGGVWFVMWKDGVYDWVADSNPSGALTVSASIQFASDYNGNDITSLTVKGR